MQPIRAHASLMGMDMPQRPAGARFIDPLPRELVLDVHSVGLHLVVTVSGDLDLHTAPQLRSELSAQARRGHARIVVDLDGVTFLDSVGLGVLVGARNLLLEVNGTLDVVCGNERLLRLFRLTALDQLFPLHASAAALH